MILTNCVSIEEVLCGCSLRFSPLPTTPSYGILDLSTLFATGCTLTEYVIDWYLNGEVVLTTGSSFAYDSSIQFLHPGQEKNSTPIDVAGTYYPVVRKAIINGEELYGSPKPCKKYCELNTLDPIVIEIANCAAINEGNTSITNYDYGVYYSPQGQVMTKNLSFRFDVDIEHKYLAVILRGKFVPDTFKAIYNGDEDDIIMWYEVGSNTAEQDGRDFIIPSEDVYLQEIKVLIDYSEGRTVTNEDFVIFSVTAGLLTDTEWAVGVKCLDETDFEITPGVSQCNYIYPALREYRLPPDLDAIVPTMSYSSTTCTFTLTFFLRNVVSSNLAFSNLQKYTNLTNVTSNNGISLNATTGQITATLTRSRTIIQANNWGGNPKYTPTQKMCWHMNLDTNTFTHFYYTAADYTNNGWANRFVTWVNPITHTLNYVGCPLITPNYSNKADVWYYRDAYYTRWVSGQGLYNPDLSEINSCFDSLEGSGVLHFHPESTILAKATESVAGVGEVVVTSMVELRFRSTVLGKNFTGPTINSQTGMSTTVINRIVNRATTYKHDAIHIRGSSGQFTFTVVSGTTTITKTVTFDTDLVTTVNKFVTNNVAEFAAQNIQLVAYTGFIGAYETIIYDGVRNDFVENFPYDSKDATTCNNRYTIAMSNANMVGSTRTITLSVAPATAWERGDIIVEQSTGASCTIVGKNSKTIVGEVAVINPLIYDIKYTVTGTFSTTPTIEVIGNPGKTAIQTSRPIIGASPVAATSGSTGCYNGSNINGAQMTDTTIDEVTKSFYMYYEYPLQSLNTLCHNSTGWVQEGLTDRFYIFYFTVNFDKIAEEIGKTTTEIVALREGNYSIYNRLNGDGEVISILQLNVAPSTTWEVGDVVRDITYGYGECTIVTVISPLSYYVTGITGWFPDGCIIGVVGNIAKQADQTIGAPRIVGTELYKKVT